MHPQCIVCHYYAVPIKISEDMALYKVIQKLFD